MRVLSNETSPKPRSPCTPGKIMSPAAREGSTPQWLENLKIRNKMVRKWNYLPPLYSGQESRRDLLNAIPNLSEREDPLFGNKASIEYLDDEDDIAKIVYGDATSKMNPEGGLKLHQVSGYGFDALLSED
jgi:hypothetical protein